MWTKQGHGYLVMPILQKRDEVMLSSMKRSLGVSV